MLQATERLALEFLVSPAKAIPLCPKAPAEQSRRQRNREKLEIARGLGHETPAAIDCCLRIADEYDVQVTIHTDTLNESGFLEATVKAIGGRTIHTYHSEGAGGGHAPDIIRICGEPDVLPSSANPDAALHRQYRH